MSAQPASLPVVSPRLSGGPLTCNYTAIATCLPVYLCASHRSPRRARQPECSQPLASHLLALLSLVLPSVCQVYAFKLSSRLTNLLSCLHTNLHDHIQTHSHTNILRYAHTNSLTHSLILHLLHLLLLFFLLLFFVPLLGTISLSRPLSFCSVASVTMPAAPHTQHLHKLQTVTQQATPFSQVKKLRLLHRDSSFLHLPVFLRRCLMFLTRVMSFGN